MRDEERKSGLLLHISSLPSAEGIGTLGVEAFRWIERLSLSGQRIWQILPLGPTGFGDSPYQSYSSYAGNPLFIDLEKLVERGWLRSEELGSIPASDPGRVDFDWVRSYKEPLLRLAFDRFSRSAEPRWREGLRSFELEQVEWLEDYALFMALHRRQGDRPWNRWPAPLRDRESRALEEARRELFEEIEYEKFLQFLFDDQWKALRNYAAEQGVEIVGDLPIYLAYDSADCWTRPELFLLDEKREPSFVAGVPPDYFSETGQLWGNPLYDWERHAAEGYAWWVRRLRHQLTLCDRVRIDHFRAFEAYWAVPAGAQTAAEGEWRPGPGAALFERLCEELGELPLIAEDLGIITSEVEELRDRFGLPGMKVLQFAFDGNPANPYLPHNHLPHSVLYTGTHDNDTTLGWFRSLADRRYLFDYLQSEEERFLWDFLRTLQRSVCALAILPLQDLLGLGSDARMNTPGTTEGNWTWRCTPKQMEESVSAFERLAKLSRLYGR
ncbi:4-alpha-glucanotransferase [Nitratifractor sp.]